MLCELRAHLVVLATGGVGQVYPTTTNPITATGTKTGLTITDVMAENNVDPTTKAALADRLQFTLTNTSTAPMTGLEVYYTMKDTTTLPGFLSIGHCRLRAGLTW